MGWSLGWDQRWNRDVGYGVPAYCDHPDCNEEIDRGLSYVCGSDPFGGEYGCGLYFCAKHLTRVDVAAPTDSVEKEIAEEFEPEAADDYADEDEDEDHVAAWIGLCERCADRNAAERGEVTPFDPKPEHPQWLRHVLTDSSWLNWRTENPAKVAQMRNELGHA